MQEDLETRMRRLEGLVGTLLDDDRLQASLTAPLPVGDSRFRFHRAGQSYMGGAVGPLSTMTALALLANRLYAVPFYVPEPIRVDQMAVEVTTAVAGSARLGIYGQAPNLYPGPLSYEGEMAISTSTNGTKTAAFSETLTLSRGLKWLALIVEATPTILGVPAVSAWDILGRTSGNPTGFSMGWRVSSTYSLGLPPTFPESASMQKAGPLIWLQVV